MKARTALVTLLKESAEWRAFFKGSCLKIGYRLASQGWQFRAGLADKGQEFRPAEVEDAVLSLARDLFPESPASEWDPVWADKLTEDAMDRMQEHYSGLSEQERDALDLSVKDPYEESMVAAGEENDPVAFRAALKGWQLASMAALHEARIGGKGAA